MKITIFTSTVPDFISLYQIQEVRKCFKDVIVVAVDVKSVDFKKERIQSLWKLFKKRGYKWFFFRLIDRFKLKRVQQEWNEVLAKSIEKEPKLQFIEPLRYDYSCKDVNGESTTALIASSKPDILIQCGAGILKENIFSIPTIATINVHGAMAPGLRGGNSIFWSYYYGRPDWLGVTVHKIDKGIDTGEVFDRKLISYEPGKHPAGKMVESCLMGAELLCEVLMKIQAGNATSTKMNEKSVYLGFYGSAHYISLLKNKWYPVDTNTYVK